MQDTTGTGTSATGTQSLSETDIENTLKEILAQISKGFGTSASTTSSDLAKSTVSALSDDKSSEDTSHVDITVDTDGTKHISMDVPSSELSGLLNGDSSSIGSLLNGADSVDTKGASPSADTSSATSSTTGSSTSADASDETPLTDTERRMLEIRDAVKDNPSLYASDAFMAQMTKNQMDWSNENGGKMFPTADDLSTMERKYEAEKSSSSAQESTSASKDSASDSLSSGFSDSMDSFTSGADVASASQSAATASAQKSTSLSGGLGA